MAVNPSALYGRDLGALADCDDLFTDIEGLGVVSQDALHSITQENFLGVSGDGRGMDVRLLIGIDTADLKNAQLEISEVLTRDDRVDSADVALTESVHNGFADVTMKITLTTSDGSSITFTKSVLDLTTTFGDPES
jgi:hypothetical protein